MFVSLKKELRVMNLKEHVIGFSTADSNSSHHVRGLCLLIIVRGVLCSDSEISRYLTLVVLLGSSSLCSVQYGYVKH